MWLLKQSSKSNNLDDTSGPKAEYRMQYAVYKCIRVNPQMYI